MVSSICEIMVFTKVYPSLRTMVCCIDSQGWKSTLVKDEKRVEYIWKDDKKEEKYN